MRKLIQVSYNVPLLKINSNFVSFRSTHSGHRGLEHLFEEESRESDHKEFTSEGICSVSFQSYSSSRRPY